MLASARALAADTNSAILNRNEAGVAPPILNAEYKELISTIYEHSKALVKTSAAAGDYAAGHRQAVEAGLKVPSITNSRHSAFRRSRSGVPGWLAHPRSRKYS